MSLVGFSEAPARRALSIRPLPLLTAINFFNYMDRQVVYGMTPALAAHFDLTKFRLGLLSLVNLGVFALASLVSGPIADRVGPRRVIFLGVLLWSVATIASAISVSFPMLLLARALVGIGEGCYGPSANALLCATAPPKQQGRVLGIYNAGMAIGGSAGLFLGAVLSPVVGWRGVFWIAGAPSMLLALLAAFLAAPPRIKMPEVLPARPYLLNPTYVMTLIGGILVTFGVSATLFWARVLVIDERGFSVLGGSAMMLSIGIFCGIGGVVSGGLLGDAVGRRRRGGHALVAGLALVTAVPMGLVCLLIPHKAVFVVSTALFVFLLSMFNSSSIVIVDELAPARYAATLQAVFLFGIHLIGDATAGSTVGFIARYTTIGNSLLVAVAAIAVASVIFLSVSRRQRREGG
jgi:MFS transporter, Spinster family, sphingosine-1-phosphate transporter